MSAPLVSARAVRGELSLRAERDATGRTVLAHRHAAGAFHLSKPYWDGHSLMVQWINPTAGIFAGDELNSEVSVGNEASLLVTTPSATRIHNRINPAMPAGRQEQRFKVHAGGWLESQAEWLMPQRGSAFEQRTEIDLEGDAGLFYTELLAPGRVAHGEALVFDELMLRLRLRIDGIVALQERLHCDGNGIWVLRGKEGVPMFVATLLLRLPKESAQVLKRLRSTTVASNDCNVGITDVGNGLTAMRLTALNGRAIRATISAVRGALRELVPPLRTELRKL